MFDSWYLSGAALNELRFCHLFSLFNPICGYRVDILTD